MVAMSAAEQKERDAFVAFPGEEDIATSPPPVRLGCQDEERGRRRCMAVAVMIVVVVVVSSGGCLGGALVQETASPILKGVERGAKERKEGRRVDGRLIERRDRVRESVVLIYVSGN